MENDPGKPFGRKQSNTGKENTMMQINEKWILLEEQKPELVYRSVYADAGEGDIAEEEESKRVIVLSADGEIGIAFYNVYSIKGDDIPKVVFPGFWLHTEQRETGTTNVAVDEGYLENIYAWQPLPEIC